ncbi:DUF2846 domain-containing protein [Aliarcobacter skirrowii]|uniref:DUF2846 domain-containing protein n=1 Tax=Aliarcobacter skirrowii TaxID=28200 RepID=UPI0029B8D23F|nr:DUF2846 domain-containing protein [Aliarcobacter skirrowii]MDX4058039.1 DUF2846 domain-containing protein [Aliarcobacter skirrowii]
MKKILFLLLATATIFLFTGCYAKVDLESKETSNSAKLFKKPTNDKSGLYIYRNDSFFGGALTKELYINDKYIGKTAPGVFFYEELEGDKEYKISTQSEFSPNSILLTLEKGKLYFVRQYIKMGVFIGGANLEVIDSEKAKKAILELDMAKKISK